MLTDCRNGRLCPTGSPFRSLRSYLMLDFGMVVPSFGSHALVASMQSSRSDRSEFGQIRSEKGFIATVSV